MARHRPGPLSLSATCMLAPIFVNEDEDITKGRQRERSWGGKDKRGGRCQSEQKGEGLRMRLSTSSWLKRPREEAMGINRRVRPSSLLVLLHARFLPLVLRSAERRKRALCTTTPTHAKGRLAEVLLLHAPHGAPHKYLGPGKLSTVGREASQRELLFYSFHYSALSRLRSEFSNTLQACIAYLYLHKHGKRPSVR